MGYYFMVLIFLAHWNLVFDLLNFSNFLPISWAIWFWNVWPFTSTEKSQSGYDVSTGLGQTLEQTPKIPKSRNHEKSIVPYLSLPYSDGIIPQVCVVGIMNFPQVMKDNFKSPLLRTFGFSAIHTSHQSLENMHCFEVIFKMFGWGVFEFLKV